MNKQEKKIVQQQRELTANPPPQVRNHRWFWSLQDLLAKFDPTDPLPFDDLPDDPEEKGIVTKTKEIIDEALKGEDPKP